MSRGQGTPDAAIHDDAEDLPRARAGWADWITRNVSPAGLLVGALCFALSLTPSLLPRTPLIQGILSGCIFSIGYALGAAIEWVWRFLELRLPGGRIRRWLGIVVWLACIGFVLWCLSQMAGWQDSVRAAMGLDAVGTGHPILVVLVALIPAVILIVLGTLLAHAVEFVSHRLAYLVPPRVAILGGLVIVGIVTSSLFSGFLLRGALRAADAFFLRLDQVVVQFGEPAPADPLKSGSAQSLVPWNTIGHDGRLYVTTGPTSAQIAALTNRPAKEPLRVYVGLRSAETAEERAQLALRELQRVGAFERGYLVIIMPVGTGWVDPPSIGALEFLEDGDVASVSVQYSYLVSPLSLVIEPDYGTDTAEALFEAVYRYWTTLPHDARPKLYLSGLSLGAHASQASTQFLDVIADPFNGALWTGPPFTSPIWRWATDTRKQGSPEWRPVFGDQSSIRFANRGSDLSKPTVPWGPMRIAFLQYPSDPIVFFDIYSWYREPAWMKGERGEGVSKKLTWYPVVTFFQLGMDMALSNNSPLGYGHVYSSADYVDSWVSLVEPAAWDATGLDALKVALSAASGRDP